MKSTWEDKDTDNYRNINKHKELSIGDEFILSFLEKKDLLKKGLKVLSVGAGPAQLETFLAKEKHTDITIVEPDQTFFSEAVRRGCFTTGSTQKSFQDYTIVHNEIKYALAKV